MLAERIEYLVRDLLPAGRRTGSQWAVGDVANSPGGSLVIQLAGPKRGLWFEHNGGDKGDALDLVAAVRYGGNLREALVWARAWCGVSDQRAAPARPAAARPETPGDGGEASAQRLWLAGVPSVAGTPTEHYLAGRGIDLRRMGRQPRALRHHPRLSHRESGRAFCGMVAAIVSDDGRHVGTHRTFLDEQADPDGVLCWRKAAVEPAKKVLGRVRGGSVRIWRGASARPLREARDGETVAIAEGIETALSVAIACPELRVLCAVSLGNMAAIALPPAVRHVVLCADHDVHPGAVGGLGAAIEAHEAAGRRVSLARPPLPGADWNDVLVAA